MDVTPPVTGDTVHSGEHFLKRKKGGKTRIVAENQFVIRGERRPQPQKPAFPRAEIVFSVSPKRLCHLWEKNGKAGFVKGLVPGLQPDSAGLVVIADPPDFLGH